RRDVGYDGAGHPYGKPHDARLLPASGGRHPNRLRSGTRVKPHNGGVALGERRRAHDLLWTGQHPGDGSGGLSVERVFEPLRLFFSFATISVDISRVVFVGGRSRSAR